MSNLQTREAAFEAADHLTEALEQNTRALDRVRRKYRLTLALLAAVALTLALVIKFNHDSNVNRCESGNELRAEIDIKFQSISEALEITIDGELSQAEQDFIDLLADELPPRDCSNIGWIG